RAEVDGYFPPDVESAAEQSRVAQAFHVFTDFERIPAQHFGYFLDGECTAGETQGAEQLLQGGRQRGGTAGQPAGCDRFCEFLRGRRRFRPELLAQASAPVAVPLS